MYKCSSKFPLEYKISDNYKNCFIKCSYYYYYDHYDKNFHCTNSFTCPDNYPNLISGKNECVADIIASNVNKEVDLEYSNDNVNQFENLMISKEKCSLPCFCFAFSNANPEPKYPSFRFLVE